MQRSSVQWLIVVIGLVFMCGIVSSHSIVKRQSNADLENLGSALGELLSNPIIVSLISNINSTASDLLTHLGLSGNGLSSIVNSILGCSSSSTGSSNCSAESRNGALAVLVANLVRDGLLKTVVTLLITLLFGSAVANGLNGITSRNTS